jgi:Fe-S cluster assembly protein SufD
MTVAEAQDLYLTQFDRLTESRGKADPAWLRDLRAGAIGRFKTQRFPSTRDEEFKFTPVSAIADRAFTPTFESAPKLDASAITSLRDSFEIRGLTASELVFINGSYSEALSHVAALPAGVRVSSLAALLATEPALLAPYLSRAIKFETQGFTALNTAFVSDGAVIVLPDNAVVEQPIHIVFATQPGSAATVAHPRTLVVAGRHSQARVIETFVGDGIYFTNAVTEFIGGENSHVEHCRVNRESFEAFHVSSTHVHLSRSAVFASHGITLGGALVRNDVNAVLDGEGIHATVNGLYLVDGQRLVDNHTTIDHAKPHCESHELFKGILDDRGRGVFNGKIFVREDAQKTDAKQTNQILLLSDDATINTKPQLEIWADDVKCTHGATIGQLSKDQLFYLRARGIGEDEARAMLVHAFASDMVERIGIEPLRDQLELFLLSRLPIEGTINAPAKG